MFSHYVSHSTLVISILIPLCHFDSDEIGREILSYQVLSRFLSRLPLRGIARRNDKALQLQCIF